MNDTRLSPSTPRPPAPARPSLWLWPCVLGVLTASGLLSALVSDHWGDRWSWFALGLPVAVMTWCALVPRAKPCAALDSVSSHPPQP